MASIVAASKPLAKYLYADNFQYDTIAIDQVIQLFKKKHEELGLGQASATVVYNHSLHAFSLRCAPEAGAPLFQLLQETLKTYHQTCPAENKHLKQFTSSNPSVQEAPSATAEDIEEPQPLILIKPQHQVLVLRSRSKDTSKIKALFLDELDKDLQRHFRQVLERTPQQPAIHDPRVLRAVTLDEDSDEWLPAAFIAETKIRDAEEGLLSALKARVDWFPQPKPTAPAAQPDTSPDPSIIHAWQFTGKRPTVEQWLAGMGEEELVSPDLAADKPQPHSNPETSTAGKSKMIGRARVPATATKPAVVQQISINEATANAQKDICESDTDSDGMIDYNDLRRGKNTATVQSEASQQPQSTAVRSRQPVQSQGPPHTQVSKTPVILSEADEKPSDDEFVSPVVRDAIGKSTLKMSSTIQSSKTNTSLARAWAPTTPSPNTGSVSSSTVRFPVVQRRSARSGHASTAVDGYGLIGRPDVHAAWERETVESNSAASTSTWKPQSAVACREQTAKTTNKRTANEPPKWELNVVPNQPREGLLIDVHVHDKRTQPSQRPASFPIAPHLSARVLKPQNIITAAHSPADPSEDLITFSDTTEFYSVRSLSPDPDATPAELLSAENEAPKEIFHRTMKQQAQKKKQKKQKQQQGNQQNSRPSAVASKVPPQPQTEAPLAGRADQIKLTSVEPNLSNQYELDWGYSADPTRPPSQFDSSQQTAPTQHQQTWSYSAASNKSLSQPQSQSGGTDNAKQSIVTSSQTIDREQQKPIASQSKTNKGKAPQHPQHGYAALLSMLRSRSIATSVQTSFGLCMLPDQDYVMDNSDLAHCAFEPRQIEQALSEHADHLHFVPQMLGTKDTAALYELTTLSLDSTGQKPRPTPEIKLRFDLTLTGQSHIIEVDWMPSKGCDVSSLMMQEQTQTIVCPRALWDSQLSYFRSATTYNDQALIDFISTVEIQPQDRSTGRSNISARIPATEKVAMKVQSVALLKIFRIPLKASGNPSTSSSEWVAMQKIPTTLDSVAIGGTLINAVALSEDELAASSKHSWQSYLVTNVAVQAANAEDLAWFEHTNKTVSQIMDKMRLGRKKPGVIW